MSVRLGIFAEKIVVQKEELYNYIEIPTN